MSTGILNILNSPSIIILKTAALAFCNFYSKTSLGALKLATPGVFVVKVAVYAHSAASKIAFHYYFLPSKS